MQKAIATALAVLAVLAVLDAPAFGETDSLSVARARSAIRAAATLNDHPTTLRIGDCHQLSPIRVRCQLVEEVVSTPTDAEPEALQVIELLEGPALVTLEHHLHPAYSYLRIHY